MSNATRAASGLEMKDGRDFKSGVHRLGQDVDRLKDDLTGLARDAAGTARSGVVEAKQGVRQGLEAAREMGMGATESLRGQVVTRPFTSLGIAVGIGLLVGLVIGRPRG